MSRPIPARRISVLAEPSPLRASPRGPWRAPAMAQEPPPVQKPLPEHKILAADEGTWDATIRTYEGGPDAEPSVSKGSEVNEVLPGGLWVLSKFEGDFGGMKFQGAASSATTRSRRSTSAPGSTP